MNIQEFKKTIPTLLKHNIVPFVWGMQGVGKTQSVEQLAKELGVGFECVHLGAGADIGDVIGLLTHRPDGSVDHAPPGWLKRVQTGSGIIFLDELNRAHPDILQAMFPFVRSGHIGCHKKGDGWKIVAAGNYQSGEFNVTDTSDAAWMSRFCHIELQPTVTEFVDYVERRGFDTVASFIAEHSAMLENKPKEKHEVFVSPDRRSWAEMVGPLEEEDFSESVRFEVYSGIVGPTATSAFFAYKKTKSKTIKLREILKNYSGVRPRVLEANKDKDTRFDLLTAPIDELVHKLGQQSDFLTAEGVDNLKQFFLDIPLELLSKTVKSLSKLTFSYKNELLNDPTFTEKLAVKVGKK